jgi:hypothetical protein
MKRRNETDQDCFALSRRRGNGEKRAENREWSDG